MDISAIAVYKLVRGKNMVIQIARIFTIIVNAIVILAMVAAMRSDKKNIVSGVIVIVAMIMSIGFVSTW
jgi:multisubunit Na+/H+ antiporter MnhF subunit